MNYNLKKPICQMEQSKRSGLFARLAEIAYADKKEATAYAKALGFTKTQFFDVDGAQAYLFSNKDDCVVACRGTEPTEFNDIKADLNALMVGAEIGGKVHKGFQNEVDDLWPNMQSAILKLGGKKTYKVDIWFCGHSLGAAMATIVASRCYEDDECPNPQELYTYGSPRVGDKTYVEKLKVTHHRYQNNNDVVTRVPLWIMGYRHDGIHHYFNCNGIEKKLTGWGYVTDRLTGIWRGLLKLSFDSFSDHNITTYAEQCEGVLVLKNPIK